jgi:hypothetical protein
MHATVLPMSTIQPAGDPTEPTTRVRLDGERIVIERLVVHDPALAAFLAERPADDRPALLERGLEELAGPGEPPEREAPPEPALV